jgi:hydroxymethylbilane synthase
VLAAAGLERLEQRQVITQFLSLDVMLPAPGQGALAVQCRDEEPSRVVLAPINHRESALAVGAERAFLAALGGGCALPIAAFGEVRDGRLFLQGRVNTLDGSQQIDAHVDGPARRDMVTQLGQELAANVLAQGGAALLGSLGTP